MKKVCSFVFLILFLAGGLAAADQQYTVRQGDNLNRIAKKHHVPVDRIKEANNLDSTLIKPGTILNIPSTPAAKKQKVTAQARTPEQTRAPYRDGTYHTVKKGETLHALARKYALSVEELRGLNNLPQGAKIKTGQSLLVKRTGPRTYTAKKGDTLWKIAKKFNMTPEDLMELNELETDEVVAGQKILLEAELEETEIIMQTRASLSEEIHTLKYSPELESLTVTERLVLFAKKMLDIPYRFGGSTFVGIDCSGYVQKVFGFLDVSLPRTAREQFRVGASVTRDDLSMGDLVFFRTYASFPSHVGIYLGNNLFIHASSKSRRVCIDSLETPYYFKRFIGAKRLFYDEITYNVD